MDAQLQGLLTARVRLAGTLAACLALAACALAPRQTGRADGGGDSKPGVAAVGAPGADEPSVQLAPQEPVSAPGLGPEILLPPDDAEDQVVARIGDRELRQSQAFSRLMVADPKLALLAVDLLVFDVLVARHAEQHGIRVDPDRVEQLAVAEEQRLQAQVQRELEGELDFPGYVFAMFGMRLEAWRRTLRLRMGKRLYQGYVIRYLALREDRVRVRFMMHRDEAIAREVCEKARAGADFATLAVRWSEDGRRDGGLLPAFGRGFPHPVAERAFELERGEVSEPFEKAVGDESRWFVVYCLGRFAGREVPFEEVRAELDKDLEERPLTQLETSAYTLRWRGTVAELGGSTPVKEQNGR